MIYSIERNPAEKDFIRRYRGGRTGKFDFHDVIVKKPWGYEYLVFQNDFVAIWMLQIVRKRKTSMHCHPGKNTALVLLSGSATFYHAAEGIRLKRLDSLNISHGVFHSTEASSSLPIQPVSEDGSWIMEIESPPDKSDLYRLNDRYGRKGKEYEDRRHMVFGPEQILKLFEPKSHAKTFSRKYQDLVFTVRRGAVPRPSLFSNHKAVICVIGDNQGIARKDPYLVARKNPYLVAGKIFDLEDFYEHTKGKDLRGILTLTIEREEKLMKLTDYIASYLADLGVKHIFAVCGGGAMHLVDSFGACKDIKYIATHHEQAAAMAAEGYARITGSLGAALFTSGPGGTNAVTGVCGAWVDSIPTIFISGQVTQDTVIKDTGLRQLGIQEGNIIDIISPITKYAVMVTDPNTIRYHLEKACYLATAERPGPVWLDIPLDVQSKVIDPGKQAPFIPADKAATDAMHDLEEKVSECKKMLLKSERPVLIYGYGIHLAGAESLLKELADQLRIPLVSSWTASDIIPSSHENYIGRSGIMGDRAGNFTVQNSDLVLSVGSRLSIPQVSYNYKSFARYARKIVVDIDPAELKKPSLQTDLAICADAGKFIKELLKQLGRKEVSSLNIEPWRKKCADWKKKYPVVLPEYKDNKYKVNSFYLVDQLSRKLGNDAIVVTDMGTSFTCTMQAFKTIPGQRLFTSSGFASMGFGLPGAIGACIAARRKVILITGDGGLQMNIQELQTLVHYKLPIIMFVLNNEGYLTIKLMQQNHFGRFTGSNPSSGLSCPDIIKLSDAYGIRSERISDQEELDARLDSVLSQPGPFVCEIMMPEAQPLVPRISSMKLPDGSIRARPMEDLYPFLDRKEFLENMIVPQVDVLKKS